MFIEIIGVIAILMALRAVITKDRAEKLLYINNSIWSCISCNFLYLFYNWCKCNCIQLKGFGR